MIPADLASRLRVLIDSEIKSLVPVKEVPSDLPDLEAGQRFSARVESPLPDGTFRALVAGRTVTLSMAGSAKSGDVLELVVTNTHDNTITARLADTPETASAAPQTKLSPAGQLISQLLTGRQSDTQVASLNRNEPLLPAPPAHASTLAPLLRQAVSESGLFYEAHQAQWIEGETSLESLLREPQGRTNLAPPPPQAGALPGDATLTLRQSPPTGSSPQLQAAAQQTGPEANTAARNAGLLNTQLGDAQRSGVDTALPSHTSALKIAEQLMPLVHQQLETLATHQALWQGQVWPGQTMQWEIFDPEGQWQSSSQQGGQEDGEAPPWQSTLRLKMPRLGGIEAQLIITSAGVAVRVSADSARTAQQLKDGGEALGNALEAAGVPLTGFAVQLGRSS